MSTFARGCDILEVEVCVGFMGKGLFRGFQQMRGGDRTHFLFIDWPISVLKPYLIKTKTKRSDSSRWLFSLFYYLGFEHNNGPRRSKNQGLTAAGWSWDGDLCGEEFTYPLDPPAHLTKRTYFLPLWL